MHIVTRVATLAALTALLGACAAKPKPVTQELAAADVPAQAAEPPGSPAGIPMVMHHRPAPLLADRWVKAEVTTRTDLVLGHQHVDIQLQGHHPLTPLIAVGQSNGAWDVVEALDQDGQPLPFKRTAFTHQPLDMHSMDQYVRLYQSGAINTPGTDPRTIEINVRMMDVPRRPVSLRRLVIRDNRLAIRAVEDRDIAIPALGEAVPVADGVSVLLEEVPARIGSQHEYVVRVLVDPKRPPLQPPLVVSAVLFSDTGRPAYSSTRKRDQNVNPNTSGDAEVGYSLYIDTHEGLADLARLRLTLATDYGVEQIELVSQDVPLP